MGALRGVAMLVVASLARAGDAPQPEPTPHPVYRLPQGARFTEAEVRIPRKGGGAGGEPEGDFEIAGTLNLPAEGKGPFAAVLFVSGSGTQDRHGFTPGMTRGTVGLDCGSWELLDAVADAGFAVLRVDDRGSGSTPLGPAGVGPSDIGYQALLGDARACLHWLMQRPEIDKQRVFVIGHSEGGITAPLLASEEGSGVAGVVCLAGCGRNFYDVIYDQVAEATKVQPPEMREATLKLQKELMNATREGREPDFDVVPKALWNRPDVVMSRKWMREHFNLDLTAIHNRVACPVLVANGESDMQVSPERDARLLAAELAQGSCKDVTLRLYPDLDHLFKACGGRKSTIQMYAEKRPLDPAFLRDLLAWLERRAH